MAEANRLVVHAGIFHTDDVLCAAMARAINPDVWIDRVNTVSKEDAELNGTNGVYVADIGGGKYDHHQADAAVRVDGAKYAACGLLYNEWKDDLFDNKEGQKYFEDTYIKPVELMDNTGKPNPLNLSINAIRPDSDIPDPDGKLMQTAFFDAVDRMSEILEAERYRINVLHKAEPECNKKALQALPKAIQDAKFPSKFYQDVAHKKYMSIQDDMYNGKTTNPLSAAISAIAVKDPDRAKEFVSSIVQDEIKVARAEVRARQMVQDCLAKSDGNVVVLPMSVKWGPVLGKSDAKFVIYPSSRDKGAFNLQCIPVSREDRSNRIPLPKEWQKTGPDGLRTTYKGYMAVFDNQEHAVNAAKELVRQAELEKEAAEQDHSDYHMTRWNDEQEKEYMGMKIPNQGWYGKDNHTGDKMAWIPKASDNHSYTDHSCRQDGTWHRFDRELKAWKEDTVDHSKDIVRTDGIVSLGIKSFDSWIKENYGLEKETFDKLYSGRMADSVVDKYKLYAYGKLPEFADTAENRDRISAPSEQQNERPDAFIGTYKGDYAKVMDSIVFEQENADMNREKVQNASLLQGCIAREVLYLSYRDQEQMQQDLDAAFKSSFDYYRSIAHNLSGEDRQMMQDALAGKMSDDMRTLISLSTDYMNGLDSGAPWVEETMARSADVLNAYNLARKYIKESQGIEQIGQTERELITDALDVSRKELYIAAREANIEQDYCASVTCLNEQEVEQCEQEIAERALIVQE